MTADWDRKDRAIRCTVPPLSWMFKTEGEQEEDKQEEPADGDEESETKVVSEE